MCGIAGIMMKGGKAPDRGVLQSLATALAHRGPDGEGVFVAGDIGLVHRRLAIIDLRTGAQPLHAAWGPALVANAEIYNYVELRARIGGPFATTSDCEPVLFLFREYGLDFVRELRGMYALALYDPADEQLILSRDPFGIKPLYYVDTPVAFAFASEPQALLRSGLINCEIDPQGEAALLQLQYTTGDRTVYKDVRRVLPGETIVVRGGRVIERHRLAALPAADAPASSSTEEDALADLDRVLMDTVNVHQRSDVPYGVFLSGGIDSSALLVAMARQTDEPPRALTLGFSGEGVPDERSLAGEVASTCGAEVISTEFSEADFWSLLPRVAGALDDPCADYATLPTFKLAARAREAGIKVVLSGEGGDEMFAGYGRYRSALRPFWRGGRRMRTRGILDALEMEGDGFEGWRDDMTAAEQREAAAGRTPLQTVQSVDFADWLPNDLLLKLDRCLMAWGVEGRTPFLDLEVGKFAMPLADGLKVRRGLGKWILREWLGRQLDGYPAFAKKRGFSVPVSEWIWRRGARLGELVAAQPGVRAHFERSVVRSAFVTRNKKAGQAAWMLLFYALWHHCHVLEQACEGDVFDFLGDLRQ